MEILIIVAKSAAILSIFYVLYRAVINKDTFFNANRHYLLAGIVAALVIPFIEFTNTVYMDLPVFSPVPSSIPNFSTVPMQTVSQETPFQIQINGWLVAVTVYAAGVCVMLIRLGIQLFSLQKLVLKYPSTKVGQFTYVRVQHDIAPFSFFRHICYNPDVHTAEELDMILAHEKVHASQWHTLDVLLTQVVLAIQWINPLAWLYKKSLEQNLEFIADSGAIHTVKSVKAYQHTLVKVSSTALRPALTNQFYHSLIKKRIVMLNKETSHKRNLLKLGLVLPLLGLFMYSFNVKEVVEYREVAGIVEDTAFAKAGVEKLNILKPTMTDVEIDNLSNTLEKDAENLKIRFTERKRNVNGELINIMVETKYPSQSNFYKNVTFSGDKEKTIPEMILQIANGNDLQFSDVKQEMIFRTSLEGLKTELFPKKKKLATPAHGENPLYIINGQKKTSKEVKGKSFALDGEVQILGKEEAVQKYGQAAKDGALIFKGNTIIKDDTSKNESLQPTAPATRSEKLKSEPTTEDLPQNTVQSQTSEIRFKINKNTTDMELDGLKQQLMRDHKIDLSYNLRRNEGREITMIQISYTGQGKNGNYSISGDAPIEEFYFLMSEDGTPGFWSEKSEARLKERKAMLQNHRSQLEGAREERKKAHEERRETLDEARGKKLKEIEGRREEIKSQMETRAAEMKERMKSQREELRERQIGLKEDTDNIKQESSYVDINGEQHFYVKANGKTRYYTKFGEEVDENGEQLVVTKEELKAEKKEEKARQKEMKKRLKENKNDGYRQSFNLASEDPSKQALYYIDGKKVTKDQINIDPNLIENITVLKGEKAIEIYGTAGENGAVIITTKKQ